MDYLLLAEVTAIGGYLLYLGRKVAELGQKISAPVSRMPGFANGPPGEEKSVKIIRFSDKGYSVIASAPINHENVALALSTPDLGILHADGKVQRTALENN